MLTKKTKKIYDDFAWFARTGETPDLNFSKPEGVSHYRRLVRNVTSNTLQNAFPIASKVLDEQIWKSLIDDFMRNHNSKTSSIWKLPKEFYEFVLQNNFAQKLDKPYLNDLLLLEWTEIDIFTKEDQKSVEYLEKGDFMLDKFAINRIYEIIELEYPVHQMDINEAQENRGKYFVLIYRNPEDFDVKFMNLSNILSQIIFLLEENNLQTIIQHFTQNYPALKNSGTDKKIKDFVKVLFDKHFILGYKK